MNIQITIKDYGTMIAKLYEEASPKAVQTFLEFVDLGLFNDRIIQRIAPDFVLQFTYENYNDPRLEKIIPLESSDIPFVKGTIGLGGDGTSIASPSDFFISLKEDEGKLHQKFTVLGQIIQGYEIIEKIVQVETIDHSVPGVVILQPKKDIIVEKIERL